MHGASDRQAESGLRFRLMIAAISVIVALGTLTWRLYTLQILRGEELKSKGRRNFVQRVRVPHDRGIVYDRHGRILVDNRPTLDIQITPAFLGKPDEAQATLQQVVDLLHLGDDALERIREAIRAKRGLEKFQPVTVARDLDPEQVEAIEARRGLFELDGVNIVEGRRRTYLHGTLAAHLLGYVNEIDGSELERERRRGNPERYDAGDLIGRDGLEKAFEKELRGVDGYEKIVVDAKGRRQHGEYVDMLLGAPKRVDPKPGHNISLSVDLDLQRAAEQAFDGQAGSVVALDPRTGRVLALASLPAFDPNRVSGALALAEKGRLDADPLKPWLNRAIQGQYAPGSTFKIVTALAALAARATSPQEEVYCPGYFRMGRHVWRCHKDSGHGPVNLRKALKVSCDTYFYTMAARFGIESMAAMGRALGLGNRTGFPLSGEKPGLIPDEAFHDQVDKASGGYQRGMVVNAAIGQGAVLVTPLQLAIAYAAMANGGDVYSPQLVDHVETADFRVTRRAVADMGSNGWIDEARVPAAGDAGPVEQVAGNGPAPLTEFRARLVRSLGLPDSIVDQVRDGLVAAVSEPGGTGYWRRSKLTPMAGKTGTAQVIRLGRKRLTSEETNYFERDHAWFAAFAPVDDPRIAVVVINEHSGHGGSQAAPIAVRVIDAFIELEKQRLATSGDDLVAGGAP